MKPLDCAERERFTIDTKVQLRAASHQLNVHEKFQGPRN